MRVGGQPQQGLSITHLEYLFLLPCSFPHCLFLALLYWVYQPKPCLQSLKHCCCTSSCRYSSSFGSHASSLFECMATKSTTLTCTATATPTPPGNDPSVGDGSSDREDGIHDGYEIVEFPAPPANTNNRRGGGTGVKLYPLTSLIDEVAYNHWRTYINTHQMQGKIDQQILTITYQSLQGDLA